MASCDPHSHVAPVAERGRGGIRLAWVVLALYAAGVTLLLLWPSGVQVRRVNLDIYLFGLQRLGIPLWVTPEWYAAAANVLFPAPLSAALTVLDRPRRRTAKGAADTPAENPRTRWWLWGSLVALALAAAEGAQALFLPGRVAEWDDVVLNSLGAFLGAGGVAVIRYVSDRRVESAGLP